MNIALFGYGKMGKTIEKIAIERGHKIVLKIDNNNKPFKLKGIDVAIDFSTPDSAVQNIKLCFDKGIPVVSGTTGWLNKYDDVVAYGKDKKGSFIYASNFSIGVNIFFKLNEYLAELMSKVKGYHLSIVETHHIHKLDAPSGTAISLAEQIIEKKLYDKWQLADNTNPEKDLAGSRTIPVISKREGEIPGIHDIMYKSKVDQISIRHDASSREGFALGAVVAAEWIQHKKGVFTMDDVLNI